MNKQQLLEKRIIKFPETKGMSDEDIKRNVYIVMDQYAEIQVAPYKNRLEKIKEILDLDIELYTKFGLIEEIVLSIV